MSFLRQWLASKFHGFHLACHTQSRPVWVFRSLNFSFYWLFQEFVVRFWKSHEVFGLVFVFNLLPPPPPPPPAGVLSVWPPPGGGGGGGEKKSFPFFVIFLFGGPKFFFSFWNSPKGFAWFLFVTPPPPPPPAKVWVCPSGPPVGENGVSKERKVFLLCLEFWIGASKFFPAKSGKRKVLATLITE